MSGIIVVHWLLLFTVYSSTAQILFDDSVVFDETLRSETIVVDVPFSEADNGTAILAENGGTCPFKDAVTCCLTSVNLPCSEFNNNTYYKDVCGTKCGIPCIDDSSVNDDVGVVIEAADSTTPCYDEKPAVCCEYVEKNDLCYVEIPSLTTGCRKTCQQCSTVI